LDFEALIRNIRAAVKNKENLENKGPLESLKKNGHPIRDTEGDKPPFFVLGYRQVKTYFNRIFPVSSLSFFFLPCLVIFALNYVSVSFDISIKKMVSEIKRIPLMEMSGSASEFHLHFVHCRTVWSVVNL
jgi:hypothetical protein